MLEKDLEEYGLSKNEAKVYLTLLELGSVNVGEISKRSKIYRTNIYDTLNSLIKKGLVSYVAKNKVKYFAASNPSNLLNVLKEKENQLQTILPQLLLAKEMSKTKTEVHVYESVISAKLLYKNCLNYNEPIFIYGTPREASQVLGEGFLTQFHQQRVKKKIIQKIIYNENAAERISSLRKIPYTEVKMLPKEFNSPFSTNICGDEVFLALYSVSPPLTIQIVNKEIAQLYKKYFDLLWQVAKKRD